MSIFDSETFRNYLAKRLCDDLRCDVEPCPYHRVLVDEIMDDYRAQLEPEANDENQHRDSNG